MECPDIKRIGDFPDPIHYTFYMLGYTDGVRGIETVNPEDEYMASYSSGVLDAEAFMSWLFLSAIMNQN
jgi:hypothetical protein